MKHFHYIVTVACETAEEAEQVMGERLSYDEDYGFDYSVGYKAADRLKENGA